MKPVRTERYAKKTDARLTFLSVVLVRRECAAVRAELAPLAWAATRIPDCATVILPAFRTGIAHNNNCAIKPLDAAMIHKTPVVPIATAPRSLYVIECTAAARRRTGARRTMNAPGVDSAIQFWSDVWTVVRAIGTVHETRCVGNHGVLTSEQRLSFCSSPLKSA